MKPDSTFQGRVELLRKAAGDKDKPLARWLGLPDTTIRRWRRGGVVLESKIREACAHSGLSLEWLRDGIGDTQVETAKFRPVTVAESETARIAEETPPDLRQDLDLVLKHGTAADRDVIHSVAAALARKVLAARKAVRAPSGIPHKRGGRSK